MKISFFGCFYEILGFGQQRVVPLGGRRWRSCRRATAAHFLTSCGCGDVRCAQEAGPVKRVSSAPLFKNAHWHPHSRTRDNNRSKGSPSSTNTKGSMSKPSSRKKFTRSARARDETVGRDQEADVDIYTAAAAGRNNNDFTVTSAKKHSGNRQATPKKTRGSMWTTLGKKAEGERSDGA